MAAGQQSSSERIEIRKYPNRRYYDASRSRHLTLEDIRELIRDGRDVRIVDSRNGEDITARTLTQMILEFDASKLELFTAPLLAELIRVNDQVIKGFFEKFFHQALASFISFQQGLQHQFRSGGILPGLFSGWSAWADGPFMKADQSVKSPSTDHTNSASVAELAATVQQLQEEIAKLQNAKPRNSRPRKKAR